MREGQSLKLFGYKGHRLRALTDLEVKTDDLDDAIHLVKERTQKECSSLWIRVKNESEGRRDGNPSELYPRTKHAIIDMRLELEVRGQRRQQQS